MLSLAGLAIVQLCCAALWNKGIFSELPFSKDNPRTSTFS